MEAKRKPLYPVMRKYQHNRRNKRDKLYVNGLLYDEVNGVLVRPTKSSISNYRSEHIEDSSHCINGTEREGSTRRILKANRPSVSFEHKNRFDILNDTKLLNDYIKLDATVFHENGLDEVFEEFQEELEFFGCESCCLRLNRNNSDKSVNN